MEIMKIFIENIKPNMSPYNGKGKFIVRLAESMKQKGVEITYNPKECDINLRMNGLPTNDYGIKVVRLDDIAFSNDIVHRTVWRKALKRVKNAVINADGIIYQSKVAKHTNEGILKTKAKNDVIIYNGTNPNHHQKNLLDLPNGKNYVHACQKLFPQRRLDRLLECWSEFSKDKDDVYLHVIYDRDDTYTKINISSYKNVIEHDILMQDDLDNFVYSCDSAISIKYQDSCPNFVIESIAVGTPVIISNTNGLAEILKEPQVSVTNIDPYYTHKQVEWEIPPFENRDDLINALEKVYINEKKDIEFPEYLHIDYVADKYIEFFDLLIKNNTKKNRNPILSLFNTKILNKIKKRLGYL
jgi:glycosyltransferase involved in cell wall biosynthesis